MRVRKYNLFRPSRGLASRRTGTLIADRLDETFRAARAPYLPPEAAENVVSLRRQTRNRASEQDVSEWGGVDSNHRPTDYESAALTN